ncbi:MAG: hypothetical protein A2W01_09495 [Candidatus Solincola sediminis]|uniref:Uncharacterized protein n=1 Tax=Candidatus Solincola sediminis TaxID=1797199 RepID=A0A1F2WH46_9ACTN|nr:MAG: hypothetical protein A2Y75_03115 [Candidatus Solincola sediminis]OFW60466.1 MAG: hypothetical protein A2W01_09495 [Candidatus Solincola sediminis]
MEPCDRLEDCAFFIEYEAREDKQTVLKGLVRIYCRGEKLNSCVRKQVSQALGGPTRVPKNMMPNGYPLRGSDESQWGDEVQVMARRYR